MRQDLLNNKKTSKGMTLLEVAVSTVIFGITALFLMLPVYSSMYLLLDNNNTAKANNLAKTYIKDLENEWKIQLSYDTAQLLEVDSAYTDNGNFVVNVSAEDMQTNQNNIVVVRRVKINYKTQDGKTLSEIFYDFNRP